MIYLKLLKDVGYIERQKNAKYMIVSVSTYLEEDTIVPIVVGRFIISEGIVQKSNIFESEIRVMTISPDVHVPQFECRSGDVSYVDINKSKIRPEKLPEDALIDLRPVSFNLVKAFVPDVLDYSGMANLLLNVRFKSGKYQW